MCQLPHQRERGGQEAALGKTLISQSAKLTDSFPHGGKLPKMKAASQLSIKYSDAVASGMKPYIQRQSDKPRADRRTN